MAKFQSGIFTASRCNGLMPSAKVPRNVSSLTIRPLPLPLVSTFRNWGSSSNKTAVGSGHVAPALTHSVSVAISLSESFSFGGI